MNKRKYIIEHRHNHFELIVCKVIIGFYQNEAF